jgi:hypothetical protein
MKLVPLKPAAENSSASKILLFCPVTGKAVRWNDAARSGWLVDLDGRPFSTRSYFSPQRAQQELGND